MPNISVTSAKGGQLPFPFVVTAKSALLGSGKLWRIGEAQVCGASGGQAVKRSAPQDKRVVLGLRC